MIKAYGTLVVIRIHVLILDEISAFITRVICHEKQGENSFSLKILWSSFDFFVLGEGLSYLTQ